MQFESPVNHARNLVFGYIDNKLARESQITEVKYDVLVVWFNYTLGNWKALLITTLKDDMYYEVTYNRTNAETYIDAYKKVENVSIPDS